MNITFGNNDKKILATKNEAKSLRREIPLKLKRQAKHLMSPHIVLNPALVAKVGEEVFDTGDGHTYTRLVKYSLSRPLAAH